MNAIRIYCPEGSDPETRRMQLADVETHIKANDARAEEAMLLKDFAAKISAGTPESLDSEWGQWIFSREGEDEYGHFYRYHSATCFQLAFTTESGGWDVVEEFEAESDDAANKEADAIRREKYPNHIDDWYVLRDGKNINA